MSEYTSALTAQDASATTLTPNEQYALITDVQNVPTAVEVLEDGSEYVTYGVTPASEAAGARLLAAFWPAITKAARLAKLEATKDDAESVALEAFVVAVREYDLTSDTPFHHTIAGRLKHAVLLADREETRTYIPPVQVARYHRVMHACEMDADAAAEALRTEGRKWLLSREAFLAIHYVMRGNEIPDSPYGGAHLQTSDEYVDVVDPALSIEDEAATRDYARWLLSHTTDRQESVCRLAYGFTDLASDSLREAHGYRAGDVLDDLQVGDCLDVPRSTVNRERNKALKTMRAAAEAAIREEEA